MVRFTQISFLTLLSEMTVIILPAVLLLSQFGQSVMVSPLQLLVFFQQYLIQCFHTHSLQIQT